LEEELGIGAGVSALFRDNSDTDEEENQDTFEENDTEEAPKDPFIIIMTPTTYTLGGMSMAFDTDEPSPNTDYEVGVVLSKENQPAIGSDDEQKLVEGICKNQYEKFNRAETSMTSIGRLLQSRGTWIRLHLLLQCLIDMIRNNHLLSSSLKTSHLLTSP
jgi:hypothetical protein